jgi:hypothetical protein
MPKATISRPRMQSSAWLAIFLVVSTLLTMLVATLILTGTVGVDAIGYLVLPIGASALIATIPYWRSMDEPSKEAHKFATLWGMGMACFIVGTIGFEMAAFPGVHGPVQDLVEGWIAFSKGVFGDLQGAVGFYLGIVASVLVLTLGYFIVWVGWWARQRMGTAS